MAYTMQDVVARARAPLLDASKLRYSDNDLLVYARDALALAFAKRPDLSLGNWSASYSALTLDSAFPLSDRYVPIVADYVTGRAELVNDESSTPERFTLLVGQFEAKLVQP